MTVLRKKVCMLGAFAVGKSSLVLRFVDSIFSEKYTTTIGVKIDKKTVDLGACQVSMVLWDVYGEDEDQRVLPAYLKGMAGYILVIDLSRPSTAESALSLHKAVEKNSRGKPFVLALNKSDLKHLWEPESNAVKELKKRAVAVFETSAKSGDSVADVYETLARSLLPSGALVE